MRVRSRWRGRRRRCRAPRRAAPGLDSPLRGVEVQRDLLGVGEAVAVGVGLAVGHAVAVGVGRARGRCRARPRPRWGCRRRRCPRTRRRSRCRSSWRSWDRATRSCSTALLRPSPSESSSPSLRAVAVGVASARVLARLELGGVAEAVAVGVGGRVLRVGGIEVVLALPAVGQAVAVGVGAARVAARRPLRPSRGCRRRRSRGRGPRSARAAGGVAGGQARAGEARAGRGRGQRCHAGRRRHAGRRGTRWAASAPPGRRCRAAPGERAAARRRAAAGRRRAPPRTGHPTKGRTSRLRPNRLPPAQRAGHDDAEHRQPSEPAHAGRRRSESIARLSASARVAQAALGTQPSGLSETSAEWPDNPAGRRLNGRSWRVGARSVAAHGLRSRRLRSPAHRGGRCRARAWPSARATASRARRWSRRRAPRARFTRSRR